MVTFVLQTRNNSIFVHLVSILIITGHIVLFTSLFNTFNALAVEQVVFLQYLASGMSRSGQSAFVQVADENLLSLADVLGGD